MERHIATIQDMHDIDGKAGLKKLFNKCNITGFPLTPTAAAGEGGIHYYFKYRPELAGTKMNCFRERK
ncbi:MAG: hypothetical protein AB2L14_37045 [Candidatus Xenobiia bacterium LiM19]